MTVSLPTSLTSLTLSRAAAVSRKKIVRIVAIRQATTALIYRLLFALLRSQIRNAYS